MLTLSGVTAGYGGGNVLQGVDLYCAERTVTCIVGPNGAGKSTVLRVISGLLRCGEGTIEMNGEATGVPVALVSVGPELYHEIWTKAGATSLSDQAA